MRVAQISLGRFVHHFSLARELLNRNSLSTLITGYPWCKLRNEGIPRERIVTVPWLYTPYMAMNRFGLAENFAGRQLNWQAHEYLDKHTARHLPAADVLFALSGSGLLSGRSFQRGGGIYICDRGSTHIVYQERILCEEYEKWGLKFDKTHARIREKELEEYAAADCVTVPSQYCKKTFLGEGHRAEKIKVVPYGVPLRDFYPTGTLLEKSFNILFVGQISLRKGVPYLLEAFQRFRHPHKKLLMVGLLASDIKPCLAKADLTAVEFLGRVSLERLRSLMSSSSVMVVPSLEEGMAIVQGQALACGCPLIISEATGGEELIQHGREGLIVPARSSQALLDGLNAFADAPEMRDRFAQEALITARRVGGWSAYADGLLAIFSQLLGGRALTAGK